jgi:uncharacterized protein (TIGR02996 family)
MSIEAGFLEDVLDHPDDDVPRLIYADWLTDRAGPGDDARAELIRLQCKAHKLGSHPRRPRWHYRADQLLVLFERKWLPRDLHSPRQGEWRRGFFCVQTRLWPFLCWGEQWFTHPALLEARVEVRGRGDGDGEDGGLLNVDDEHVRFLGASPLLARVTHLSVRGRRSVGWPLQGDDFAVAVAGSPHARRLRSLELSCLSDRGAAALLRSPHLGALSSLELWGHAEISPPMRTRLKGRFALTP